MKKNMIYTLLIIFVWIQFVSLWAFYSILRPEKLISHITPQNFNIPFEKVELKTSDNIIIRGWYIPSKIKSTKAILLLHGYPADKGNIFPSFYFLRNKYNLLLIDFRYLGESGGYYSTVGKKEVLDVQAAIEYLRQRGMTQIGMWGFSMGGAIALLSVNLAPEIKAVVAESSYANLNQMAYDYFRIPLLKYPMVQLVRLWAWILFGFDIKSVSPVDSALHSDVPILLIHSKIDDVVPFSHAEVFKKKLAGKPNVKFVIYDELSHGESSKAHQQMVLDFFDEHLNRAY